MQDILSEIKHEIHIIKHLATKILPDTHHYKPTEKQRSMLELMQYLSHIGSSFAQMMLEDKMDHFQAASEKAQKMTLDSFENAMNEQEKYITQAFSDITDREKEITFFDKSLRSRKSMALALLKNLVAYRMQFFLYIKQAGNFDINTSNARLGKDAARN